MTRNFSKRIRRIRCRTLNIRFRHRDNVESSDKIDETVHITPVEDTPICTVETVPLSANEKLVKARELMLEVESQMINESGYCPYELGYALRNIDQVINQVS